MKKIVAFIALGAMLLSGCGTPDKENNHSTQRRPGAGAQPAQPQGGAQQPAPVQGDPGAHNNQPGELDFHVEWASENRKTPACEWSVNAVGVGKPCAKIETPEQVDGKGDYFGLWEHTEKAKAGDIAWLSAHGNMGTKWIKCSISWKGSYHELPSKGKHCGGTFTLN